MRLKDSKGVEREIGSFEIKKTQIIKVDSIEDSGPKLTLTINMVRANDLNGDFIKFVKLGDRESNGEFLKDYILDYPITIEE
tara:strand:- start:3615 stop:3860 length:246 start_codon:yes stop_codon:yes gene_type:complete